MARLAERGVPVVDPQYAALIAEGRLRSIISEVLTESDVPDTRQEPTMYWVVGPPIQIFLVDENGKREMGFSAVAPMTGGELFLSSTFQVVPGTKITLPTPATYAVIGVFSVRWATASAVFQGQLTVGGVPEARQARARSVASATGEEKPVMQIWRISTIQSNVEIELRAAGATLTLQPADTVLHADSFLGGAQSAVSHLHDIDDLTGFPIDGAQHGVQGSGDLHPEYVREALHGGTTPGGHHGAVTAGAAIAVSGNQQVSHVVDGGAIDLHPLYQLRGEAHGGAGYGKMYGEIIIASGVFPDGFIAEE